MPADYIDTTVAIDQEYDRHRLAISEAALAGFLPSPKKQKILWVDDSSSLLTLYQAVFGSLGFEVTATSSPEDALQHVRDVDIAILDYDMPDMNGAALAALLKRSRRMLPVILYSGNGAIPSSAYQWVDAICPKGSPREQLLGIIDQLSHKQPASGQRRLAEDLAPSFSQHSSLPGLVPSSSESAASACAAND